MIRSTDIDFADIIQCRDADAAVEELRQCITTLNLYFDRLAKQFPGCLAVAGFVGGKAPGALVTTWSIAATHSSPVALERARTLARFIAAFPEEVRTAFQIEFNLVLCKAELIQAIKSAE